MRKATKEEWARAMAQKRAREKGPLLTSFGPLLEKEYLRGYISRTEAGWRNWGLPADACMTDAEVFAELGITADSKQNFSHTGSESENFFEEINDYIDGTMEI